MSKDVQIHRQWCSYYNHLQKEYEYYDDISATGKVKKIQHGYYHEYDEDQLEPLKEYSFKDGKLHGLQKKYMYGFARLLESTGEFKNGIPVGEHITRSQVLEYPTDALKDIITTTGTYVDGVIHGLVTQQIEDGTIVGEFEYINGVEINGWSMGFVNNKWVLDQAFHTHNGVLYATEWRNNKKSMYVERDLETDSNLCLKVYDTNISGKGFLRVEGYKDRDGNYIKCTEYFPTGDIQNLYTKTHHPDNNKLVWAKNTITPQKDNIDDPGIPQPSIDIWDDENYRNQELLQLQYYADGTLKQASCTRDRKFIGEFRYYAKHGELIQHSYYHNGKDIMDDILEEAGVDSIDKISEESMVFLTINYGSLRFIPEEYLCPAKK